MLGKVHTLVTASDAGLLLLEAGRGRDNAITQNQISLDIIPALAMATCPQHSHVSTV